MTRHGSAPPLTVEATWLLDQARALAASSRASAFDTLHVLAAALRADTTFGATLRRTAVTDQSEALNEELNRDTNWRTPVDQVASTEDIARLLTAASQRAQQDGRSSTDAEDIVWALTAVLGPHSRFFASGEPSVRSALDAPQVVKPDGLLRPRRRAPAVEALGSIGSLLWVVWVTIMKALSAGVTILVAGAGVVLHHAAVELAAVLFRFRVSFTGWWNEQVGGRLETNRVLSTRETIVSTLVVRAWLAAISIATFAVVLLEARGVGLTPWPRLNQDPSQGLGPSDDVDINVLVIVAMGRRPIEIWTAIGAAFMAVPTFGEVDRVRQLLASGSSRSRAAAATLRPLRAVTRLFDRFDAVTTPMGLPTMLSSGIVGVIACALAGSALADLAILLAA